MTIPNSIEKPNANDSSKKNALLVRVKVKLPKTIKAKLKQLGAIWLEVFQGYAIPIVQKSPLEVLLDPWKAHIRFSEQEVDAQVFTPVGKAQNSKELKISILQKQVHEESMRLMCDIRAYDATLSESDFDVKPSFENKSDAQIQVEATFYERRQSILETRKELDSLVAGNVGMNQGDNPFLLDKNGLWHLSEEGKTWISSPIQITARIRDENGLNHGKLLEFDDADGIHHSWPMPMEILAGDCAEFRSTLMSAGLEISTFSRARQWLADYVQRSAPLSTARCVSRTGWHKQGFVLPDLNIGNLGGERVVIQGKTCNFRGYCTAGNLLNWQRHIADCCVANSRLIFAVSAAFAGPLLHLMDLEGGGFHFYSHSSSGKTTALRAAASVYGSKDFMRKWKATINGLETIAFQHNDTLLCLDEMGEMSASEVGDAAYMLANGSGKNRARADGGLRDPLTWRILFLSSGEIGLATHMELAGKKSKAGQEIRLAEIPADTGKFGLFEELHGFPNGSIFSDSITKNAKEYYGVAGREFLKKLTQDIEGAKTFLKKTMNDFMIAAVPKEASGQIHRVASRFSLVAAAGEFAIHSNITRTQGRDGMSAIGWDEGAAHQAALTCFNDWMAAFGGPGIQEVTQLLADVRYFLEQHGESRFTDWHANDPDALPPGSRTYHRAGFRKHTDQGTEFHIFPETFKRDICKGREEKFVKETLYDHGLLKKDTQGKFTCSAKPRSESKSRRFYVLLSSPPTED
jgi:putative DNA primase/helicase